MWRREGRAPCCGGQGCPFSGGHSVSAALRAAVCVCRLDPSHGHISEPSLSAAVLCRWPGPCPLAPLSRVAVSLPRAAVHQAQQGCLTSPPRVLGTHPAGQKSFPRPPLCPVVLPCPLVAPPHPHSWGSAMCVLGRQASGSPHRSQSGRASTDQDSRGPLPALGPGASGPRAGKSPPLIQEDGWDHTLLLSAEAELPGRRDRGLGIGLGSQRPLACLPRSHSSLWRGTTGLGRARVSVV